MFLAEMSRLDFNDSYIDHKCAVMWIFYEHSECDGPTILQEFLRGNLKSKRRQFSVAQKGIAKMHL